MTKSDLKKLTAYEIKLEILNYSYWEHFNSHKSVALILPIDHTKRIDLNNEMNSIIKEIEDIKQFIKLVNK